MTETQTSLTTSKAVCNPKAVGLSEIIKKLDSSIQLEAYIMATTSDILNKLNSLLNKASGKEFGKSQDLISTTKTRAILTSIITAISLCSLASLVDMAPPEEEPKGMIQKSHRMLAAGGEKAMIWAQITGAGASAYYGLKEGKLTFEVNGLNIVMDGLKTVIDAHTSNWDSSSKSINAITKAAKEMVQNDYTSKKNKL